MTPIVWQKWPKYADEEVEAVQRVVRSNQIFAANEVSQFEIEFSKYTKSPNSIGVGNATQGLHLALAALNIGAGDEVIVTPYSWISTASCILMQNAIPIFADIESETLGLNPIEIEKKITSNTKAIIYVHMFGYPAKANEILSIGKKYNIPVIEDASHAHGMQIQGIKAGNFGDISVFSLHQRKALSVGDGGVICTSNNKLAERIRRLRSFGDGELSYNYRMTEFAGALGQVGLKKLDYENTLRRKNAQLLDSLLNNNKLIVRLTSGNNYGVYYSTLIEIKSEIQNLDDRVQTINKLGIPLKKTWQPLHRHPHFNPTTPPARGVPWNHLAKNIDWEEYQSQSYPITELYCQKRIYELDMHPYVSEENILFAANALNFLLK
jgi:perosamine synthetase